MSPKGSEGHRKRLWTRFDKGGLRRAFVHDYEKLEFLLSFVIARKDTKPMARELIERFGSLTAVVNAPEATLMEVDYIGKRAAQFLRMMQEFATFLDEAALENRNLLDAPELAKTYLRRELAWREAEYFYVLYLNTRNRLIKKEQLFRGTLDRITIYNRELAKEALRCNASGVIVAHNHPSGDPTPSREDIAVNQQLADFLAKVDLCLLDHLVIGREQVTSMVELGVYRPR